MVAQVTRFLHFTEITSLLVGSERAEKTEVEGTSKDRNGQKGPQNTSFPHKPQITPPQTILAVAEELGDTKGR